MLFISRRSAPRIYKTAMSSNNEVSHSLSSLNKLYVMDYYRITISIWIGQLKVKYLNSFKAGQWLFKSCRYPRENMLYVMYKEKAFK